MQPVHVQSATWLLFIVVVNCLRLGLSMQPWPAWNSLRGQDWPQTSGILLSCARSSVRSLEAWATLPDYFLPPCSPESWCWRGNPGLCTHRQLLCCCVLRPWNPAPSVRPMRGSAFHVWKPQLDHRNPHVEEENTFHMSTEVHVHHVHTLNWCVTN